MCTRVLTLRFNPVLEGFDDAPLRDFLKDKAVLSIRSWNNDVRNCRTANRNNNALGNRNANIGFRLLSIRFVPESRVHGPWVRA